MLCCKKYTIVPFLLALWLCSISAQFIHAFTLFPNNSVTSQQASRILYQTDDLNPQVLDLAMHAYEVANDNGISHKPLLTIIDYSLPSNQKRLWVIDLAHQTVPFHDYVAHGKNSGLINARDFSNQGGSRKSSIGVFLTGATYIGHHGKSLRLIGLEKGFNNHAFTREIVIHAAQYVSDSYLNNRGYLGRSWGCPALSPHIAPAVIQTIKNGSVVFAYYPDQNWLRSSRFLA